MIAVLVTAATGRQGGATARHLLAQGVRVVALVRSPTSGPALELQQRGAELVQGSFDETEVLQAICERVTGVFLNVSPSFRHDNAEVHHAVNVISAARAPGSTVTSLVYTSPTGSLMKEYFTSKATIEDTLRSARFDHWTILRPPVFMSNYLVPSVRWYFPKLLGPSYTLRTAMSREKRTMLIDPDDIGRFAAAALVNPATFSHRAIDIGGEALTSDQIARALSSASGVDIRVEYVPRSEAEALAPIDPQVDAQLWFWERQCKFDPSDLVQEFGIPLKSFADYLATNQDLVTKTFGK